MPDSSEIIQRLRDIFAKQGRLQSSIAAISIDANLYDAGLDSLAIVNVMLAVEDQFGVEIPDEYLNRQSFSSLAALADVLKKLQS